MKRFLYILLILLPFTASADTTSTDAQFAFQRQGIFDCNQSGSYAMSVGALSAIGGTYVPVADAAVELNTGTLVYKECILREVVDREREAATSALLKKMTVDIQTGRTENGPAGQVQKAFYVVDQNKELTNVMDQSEARGLLTIAQAVNPSLRNAVLSGNSKSYEAQTRRPANAVVCPDGNDLNQVYSSQGNPWIALADNADPTCNALLAGFISEDVIGAQVAIDTQNQQAQWNWGRGFYPRVDTNGDVITPASVVQESYQQMLGSPVRQLETANDIGQMIGALYAGVTTQVVGDINGLSGITQSVGGQLPYLDQVAQESSAGLQSAAANAALSILNAQKQIETSYLAAVTAVVTSVTQSGQQLQGAEKQCWAALVPKLCSTPVNSNGECTGTAPSCTTDSNGVQQCDPGPTLKVATSTAFSSGVISAQITPLLGQAQQDVAQAQAGLNLINNLIAGVSNTASLDAQRVALTQLDTLVQQHALHTPTNLSDANVRRDAAQAALQTLVTGAVQNWAGVGSDANNPQNFPWDGTTNPGVGWCNVNNSATLSSWTQLWKK